MFHGQVRIRTSVKSNTIPFVISRLNFRKRADILDGRFGLLFMKRSQKYTRRFQSKLRETCREVELTRNQARARPEESVDLIFPAQQSVAICFQGNSGIGAVLLS
jgi:hypothetical protein